MSETTLLALDGRIAVITGGASGIGLATAELLSALGARVAVIDRNRESLERLRDAPFGGDRLTTHRCDVADPEECGRVIAEIIEATGAIDILVTCAGIVRPDIDPSSGADNYEAIIGTNLRGTLSIAHAAKKSMIAQRRGSMVFLGSVVGQLGWPGLSYYCASKGAIHAAARSLAVELAPHLVRVNVVAPGLVWTPMIMNVVLSKPDPMRAFSDRCLEQANGRMLQPEEVARAVAFYASDLSAPATGTIHDLSVGRVAGHIPAAHAPGPEFLDFSALHAAGLRS